jgi:hypothetical protein
VCRSDKAPAEADFFRITAADYRRWTGREHNEKQETKRRQDTPYGAAMARLRASAGRRRSASAAYLVYVADCLETLPVRVPELVSTDSSVVRWMRKCNEQSANARAANVITLQESNREDKAACREAYDCRRGAPKLDDEKRRWLVERLQEIRFEHKKARTRGEQPKVVVFYGAARFPSQFAHDKVRRQVGLRALHVNLFEGGSSAKCPCSVGRACLFDGAKADDFDGHELVDIKFPPTEAPLQAAPSSAPMPRLHAHKGGGECFLARARHNMPKHYSPDEEVFFDRDDLAALNLLVIGRSWYHGQGRPQAFRRREG